MSTDTGTMGGMRAPALQGGRNRPVPARWRAVRRHSRRVRLLRVVLPAIGLAIAASMFVSIRSLPGGIGNISLGEVGVEGTTLTMSHPSLSGYGSDGVSYDVTAERALQDLTTPDVVRMEMISGTMRRADGTWTSLEARDGLFDSARDWLMLENDIVIVTDDGKRAYLEDAEVDLKGQSVISLKPVRAEMAGALVRGDRMEVNGGGDHIILRDNVSVVLQSARRGAPQRSGE